MSSGGGHTKKTVVHIISYTVPAAMVWGLLGLAVSQFRELMPAVLTGAVIYGIIFGLSEIAALPVRVPSLPWQVPSHWVRGRSDFTGEIIWGIWLGPGLVTRNPYAGMWLLPILLVLGNYSLLDTIVVGSLVGVAHGCGRALGVRDNCRQLGKKAALLDLMAAQWRWRLIDGMLLSTVVGAIVGGVLARMSM